MEASLLRDWDLLQERVVPPLLGTSAAPRVWSIGGTADAVAVTVAFLHAKGSGGCHEITAFATHDSSAHRHREPAGVRFASTDLDGVPADRRSAWFRRQDRWWVPRACITERVVLAEPDAVVDLMTVRAGSRLGATMVPETLDRLRDGGLVLFLAPPAPPPDGLEPVGVADRLFHKQVRDPRPPAGGAPGPAAGPTLAERQRQDELVSDHLGLARSLARRFSHRGERTEDLESVACLALVKAARRFDPGRGPFGPYATASVLGELKRHFRDRTWALRVPRPLQELYLTAKAAHEDLSQQLGVAPTVPQLAEHLGVSEEDLLEAMEAGSTYRTDSLDGHRPGYAGPGPERTLDVGDLDPALDRVLDRQRVRQAMPRLDRTEQLLLQRLYFDGRTQQEVAEEIGSSQMHVSRLLARAMAKLRR